MELDNGLSLYPLAQKRFAFHNHDSTRNQFCAYHSNLQGIMQHAIQIFAHGRKGHRTFALHPTSFLRHLPHFCQHLPYLHNPILNVLQLKSEPAHNSISRLRFQTILAHRVSRLKAQFPLLSKIQELPFVRKSYLVNDELYLKSLVSLCHPI